MDFGIFGEVNFIHEDDDGLHTNLAAEEDVLPGLGHHSVGCTDHEDGGVHFCGAGDHVLNIVDVPGAVNVARGI